MSDSGHSAEGDDLSLQEVTRRVQKLIAVAERTTHPDESDAFSRKAAELIARYRLSAEALRSRHTFIAAPARSSRLAVPSFQHVVLSGGVAR